MKILVAVDGSAYTTKAVQYLASHLSLLQDNLELHLLHVKAPIPPGRARAVLGTEAVDQYYKEEAEQALAVAETPLKRDGIPFRSSYRVGDVAEQVQAYVRENKIDMIVMGSHGHGAFKNLVMGSVATKVLASTNVPALLVR
jgi:nucleotide-binding universal stress UspA family protein